MRLRKDVTEALVADLTLADAQRRRQEPNARSIPTAGGGTGSRILTLAELFDRCAAHPTLWWTVGQVDPTDPREVASRKLTRRVIDAIRTPASRRSCALLRLGVLELARDIDQSLSCRR